MAWYEDKADIFLASAEITSAPIADLGRELPAWDLMSDLSVELNVSAAAADSGDSLAVVVQHSLDKVSWQDLIAFAVVAGDATVPYSELKSLGKGAAVSAWGPWLRVGVSSGYV